MDITHTGSSMKWRTALLVLHHMKHIYIQWGGEKTVIAQCWLTGISGAR